MSAWLPTDLDVPEPLPEGERVLWQGAPAWRGIARRALHVRALAAYFALVAAWTCLTGIADHRPPKEAAAQLGLLAGGGLLVLLLALGFATLVARTTRYTVTTRRVIFRIGVALPITVNLPYAILRGAGLKTYPDGTGDIPLALGGEGRIAFIHLWPHARPWRLSRPEPMLRAIPNAAWVASILASAILDAKPDAASAEAPSSAAAPASPASPQHAPLPPGMPVAA
ncbi:MAG: PH domain-containing protein [Methylobacteriaceae bacterium]|nr:PH domain-containing protein [Methylobacteriaceae bacterium]